MIVQMKRICLVAHRADEQEIIKALQAIEAVQVLSVGDAQTDGTEAEAAQARVQELRDALTLLKPYAAKKGLLSARPEVTVQAITSEIPEALADCKQLEEVHKELTRVRSEKDKNDAMIEMLAPWLELPDDMSRLGGTSRIRYFAGIVAAPDVEKLRGMEGEVETEIYGEGALVAAIVACYQSEAKQVASFLKTIEWTDFAFPKLPGTPSQASEALHKANRTLEAQAAELEAKLTAFAPRVPVIEGACDAAEIQKDRALAAMELVRSEATFELEGWMPVNREEDVIHAVESVTDAYYFNTRDPNEDEVPPSVVQNNKMVTPFEQVTNLYSRPDPKGLDGTPYMMPFYVLLFGLMLSDTGYGILLTVLCLLYLKLKKPTGMSGGFVRVLVWGGVSTIVWGFLVGTFFGLDFDVIFGTTDVFPLMVDPMKDPIMMLIICFGLGVLHILFGVVLKMKMCFRDGDWQTAIFDNFSWILIVIGLIVFAGSSAVEGIPALVGKIGVGMAIVGAAMILFMKGRKKKNIFGRTISGLGELYQVTSYLSDILSYARLFALGIATGVIALVFNQLCGMLMNFDNVILDILATIIAIALLICLHLFNLAINTLGAFVHCARLQYVEFYGKFYEAGGITFRPLGYQTRHVRIAADK